MIIEHIQTYIEMCCMWIGNIEIFGRQKILSYSTTNNI
jgi:hypothetical protein